MKTKGLLVFFALLLVSGMVLVIQFGLQPRPVPKIKLSSFDSPIQAVRSIQLNLHEQITDAPILLVGYQSEHSIQLEIVKGLLDSLTGVNAEPTLRYDTVVADSRLQLPDDFKIDERLETLERVEDLMNGLSNNLQAGKRTLVLLPAVYSSQLIETSVQRRLREKFQKGLMSFTFGELIRRRDLEKNAVLPCSVPEVDSVGTGALGCAILQTSRVNYRKKMPKGKHTGLMEQRGLSDYLILYSPKEEL